MDYSSAFLLCGDRGVVKSLQPVTTCFDYITCCSWTGSLAGAEGGSTKCGFATQVNPLNVFICCPFPRSPPEQLRSRLMQLSVHIFITWSSHAPNQSVWKLDPGFMGIPGMSSDERCQLANVPSHLPDLSSVSSTLYQAPSVKVGMI